MASEYKQKHVRIADRLSVVFFVATLTQHGLKGHVIRHVELLNGERQLSGVSQSHTNHYMNEMQTCVCVKALEILMLLAVPA